MPKNDDLEALEQHMDIHGHEKPRRKREPWKKNEEMSYIFEGSCIECVECMFDDDLQGFHRLSLLVDPSYSGRLLAHNG